MNCKSVQIYLSAYLDGELCGQECLQVRDHLSDCRECRAEEQQLRSLKQMLRGLPTYAPNAEFEDRLVKNVLSQSERTRVFNIQFHPRWNVALGVAAGLAILGFGFVKLTERTVPHVDPPPTALNDRSFDISRDQMFMAGNDPLSGNRFVVPTSYGKK